MKSRSIFICLPFIIFSSQTSNAATVVTNTATSSHVQLAASTEYPEPEIKPTLQPNKKAFPDPDWKTKQDKKAIPDHDWKQQNKKAFPGDDWKTRNSPAVNDPKMTEQN
jgi:hypothetical protein